jgi:hypothetical protein
MDSPLRLSIKFSTSHLFFPKIVIGVLIILGAAIILTRIIPLIKNGRQATAIIKWRFFKEKANIPMLLGSFILLILYILALQYIGFVLAGIIFVFLFNVLFCATKNKKSILISAVISILSSIGIWYIFGVLFKISLP